jgi:hypothetical protein
MTFNETIPWSTTGGFVLGALGLLGAVLLVFKVVLSARELFGRKPSLGAELEKREQLLRLELQTLDLKIVKLRQDMDSKFESLAIERSRNVAELHDKINRVAGDVAYIKGYITQKRLQSGDDIS